MDGVVARANELRMLNTLSEAFEPLVTIMHEKHKWAFQEGIIELLINDLRDSW